MVTVDHLIATVKTAIDGLQTKRQTTDSSGLSKAAGSTPTAARDRFIRLRQKLKRSTALAKTVRLQVARLPVNVDDSKDAADGRGPSKKESPASCFRWSDGVLVEALERGDWVVLDGANLCSAR